MLQTICGVIAGMSGGLPLKSIDFESTSGQYLSMSDANFGTYDLAKFAVSVFVKRESTGVAQTICGQEGAAPQRSWYLQFNSGDNLFFVASENGTNVAGRLLTTAAYTNTSSFYHIFVTYDSANGTSGNRMRMWVNGTEITSFSIDDVPTAQVSNSTANFNVGAHSGGTAPFDGLMYNWAFFSGTLPAVTDVRDSVTGLPKSVVGLPGLKSVLGVDGDVVTQDGKLAPAWTNNNAAVASATIPT